MAELADAVALAAAIERMLARIEDGELAASAVQVATLVSALEVAKALQQTDR